MLFSARRRTVLAALMGAALPALAPAGPVSASSSAEQGWVRLAHFSPDTPAVDVYLSAFTDPAKPVVFRGVGYGVLSDYQRLPAGRYTVAMRPKGAPSSSAPAISTDVRVSGAGAYTIAGVGRNANLAIQVIIDDLSSPPAGQGRARVIQASSRAPVVTVRASDGTTLAEGASFPSTSMYALLQAGLRNVTVSSGGTEVARAALPLSPGDVYSLVILDDPSAGAGAVQVLSRNDARSASATPSGGVETGLGGMAGGGSDESRGARSRGAALLLLLLGGGGVVALRATSRPPR